MESRLRRGHPLTTPSPSTSAWRPELLDGTTAADVPPDSDIGEIWRWFHARLEWIGGMTPQQAHLAALLHWRERHIRTAIGAARLEANQYGDLGDGRKAYIEYRAADYLTQMALGLDSLPELEPQPA